MAELFSMETIVGVLLPIIAAVGVLHSRRQMMR